MEQTPEILPYFPLSVFLLPGEDMPLRIFEPRYQQLIGDARSTGITFAIPYVINQKIQEYGCEVGLKEVVAENPGGRMVITVESLSVVQILSFSRQLEGKLYSGGSIRRIPCTDKLENKEPEGMIRDYAGNLDNDFLLGIERSVLSLQDIMKALNLPSDDKYRFVCLPDGSHKERFLLGQLKYLNLIRRQELQLGNDFGQN